MEKTETPKANDKGAAGRASAPPPAVQPEFQRRGLAREFWEYLMENKVWWMAPILLMFLLLALLLVFGSGPMAVFIYPLF